MRKFEAKFDYTGCPLCYGAEGEHCQIIPSGGGDYTTFDCYICGRYRVSGTVMSGSTINSNLQISERWRANFSHMFRLMTDSELFDPSSPPMLVSEDIEKSKKAEPRLPSPSDQIVNLIRVVGNDFIQSGKPYVPDGSTRSRIGCVNSSQMNSIIEMAARAGLLFEKEMLTKKNSRGGNTARRSVELALDGWEKFEASQHGLAKGNYGFLAMKFGDLVLDRFISDVKPRLSDLIGYDLVDLREVSRAGVIDNILREQIRDAAFVIVDLTHDNSGAYWEAGYGEGLGKPVIYICERQKFDDVKTHFDTNHCTTVPWLESDPDNFVVQLGATIRRSLGMF